MDGFRLFQDISGKLDKGSADAQSAGSYMDIKTGIVKTAFKKKTPFFNKAEILAEGEIGKGVIYKE